MPNIENACSKGKCFCRSLRYLIYQLHLCINILLSAASSADVQTGLFFAYVPGKQNVVYIKVQIFDDKLLEGTEAFRVQLSIPNHHKENGVKLGDPSGATIFIKDGMHVVFCR